MKEKLNEIQFEDKLYACERKIKRQERKLKRIEMQKKMIFQKLVGLYWLVASVVSVKLGEITPLILCLPLAAMFFFKKEYMFESESEN